MTTVVDVRGLPCPQPVIKTKKALQEIKEGTITVMVDRPEARDNVQRFAHSQGCQVEIIEKEGVFYLNITKGKPAPTAIQKSGDVVFITTDVLGIGDEKLGAILMKAFLNTLWDTEPRPAKILFLNSAVRLTTEGSDVLDTLKLLEKEGVQIFSCGTCLEYYNLKDDLRVGMITNMHETVNSLHAASKVIHI